MIHGHKDCEQRPEGKSCKIGVAVAVSIRRSLDAFQLSRKEKKRGWMYAITDLAKRLR